MSKFMLILNDTAASMQAWSKFTPQQIQQAIEKYMRWTEDLAKSGRLGHCDKLKEEGGKRLSLQGGKVNVVDGPYAEAKEVVGGYYMVEAKSYAEAVEIAKTCPQLTFGGTIDVRETDPIPPS